MRTGSVVVLTFLVLCAPIAVWAQPLQSESCNGLDDDGDGFTDEDFPTLGAPCDGGDPDRCFDGHGTCREDGSGVECVDDGALAYLRFDEGAGSYVRSDSGRVTSEFAVPPRRGVVVGARWTTSGYTGSALVFDGVDDTVDVPHHPSLDVTDGLTIEARIFRTDGPEAGDLAPGWRAVAGLFDRTSIPAGAGWYLAHNPTQGPGVSAWLGLACGWVYSDVQAPYKTWAHVAVTYDGAHARLYVDGARVAERPCAGNGGQLVPCGSPLHIGGLGADDAGLAPFAGGIDDVAVYGRALTDQEIAARYRDGDACDGADNDCDGLVDEALYVATETTGVDPALVGRAVHKFDPCDGDDSDRCAHGTWSCASDGLGVVCANEDPKDLEEWCNGLDDDCDGALPDVEQDADNDGFLVCEGDCDDASPLFHPAHPELCDGLDNDCDGVLPVPEQDLDGDGHFACCATPLLETCGPLDLDDCDDGDPRVHSGHDEVCDGIDNDCDGLVDDADPDYAAPRIDSYFPIGAPAGDPDTGPRTLQVTVYGRNFVPTTDGAVTSFDFGPGITVDDVVIPSTQMMRVTITITVVVANACSEDVRDLFDPRDITIRMGTCELVIPRGFDIYRGEWYPCPDLSDVGLLLLAGLLLLLGLRALRRRPPRAA